MLLNLITIVFALLFASYLLVLIIERKEKQLIEKLNSNTLGEFFSKYFAKTGKKYIPVQNGVVFFNFERTVEEGNIVELKLARRGGKEHTIRVLMEEKYQVEIPILSYELANEIHNYLKKEQKVKKLHKKYEEKLKNIEQYN